MAATQVNHPWRATVRTIVQGALAFITIFPLIVVTLDLPEGTGVAFALAATGGVARVMALPQVEGFIRVYLPWLAAQPKAAAVDGEGDLYSDPALDPSLEADSTEAVFYR